MLKKFVISLVTALGAALLMVPSPTSAQGSNNAPGDVRIAPGRFDTVRIGDSLESAAESGYFALDVKSSCGRRAIWPTKEWRKSIDVYQGYEEGTVGTVGTIGVFGDGIATKEGIEIGSTLADLQSAYGDSLLGPRPNDYGQWGYFIRAQRRWIGFSLDASNSDGRPGADAAVTFMELTKGRRPGLLRDGC